MSLRTGKDGLREMIEGVFNLRKDMPEINRAAIAEIAKEAVKIAKRNIENGGDPSEPHSEFTPELTKKLRGGDTKWVLEETGALKKSIRIMSNTVAFGQVYVEIGSDLVYAAILEFGGNPEGAVGDGQLSGYIPPRPYLMPAINEAIYNAVGGTLEARIAKAYELSVSKKKWKHLFK